MSSLISKKNIIEQELIKIIQNLAIIIHPFVPHISEEIWNRSGNKGLCASASWPKTQRKFEESVIKLPVQINGKTRSLVDIVNNEDKNSVMKKVMGDSKIIKYTENMEIIKTVFVKNKIVNLVVR